jgi:ankyrin repeat protein
MFAAGQGEADVVRILMSRGADPNLKSKEGETALVIATKGEHKETARVLREARIAGARK